MMMDNNAAHEEERARMQPPSSSSTSTGQEGGGELEWQDVAIEQETGLLSQPQSSPQGMGMGMDDEDDEEGTHSGAKGGAKAPEQPKTGFAALCACFSVEFYQPYFDVDTMDIARRMSRVFYPPRTPNFSELTAEKPDLYGPIWIGITLVFLLGAMSNFVQWAHFKPKDDSSIWRYDFTLVTLAVVFVFSYIGLMALVSWAFLRYIGVRLTSGMVRLVGLWGYALLPFYIPTVFCTIPSPAFQWIITILSSACASYFMVYNFAPVLREKVEEFSTQQVGKHYAKLMALGFVIAQLGLGLCLKLVFFSQV